MHIVLIVVKLLITKDKETVEALEKKATGEMGPFYQYFDGDGTNGAGRTPGTLRYHSVWYVSQSHFVDSTYPWFIRGGMYDDGGLAGQFHFGRNTGAVLDTADLRLVLATK